MCGKKLSQKNSLGFTLIEVLIALAILSIALTAIIKSTAEDIRNTNYLQNKMLASWVGMQVMNEILVGILKLPDNGVKSETTLLRKTFTWQAQIIATPNPHIKEIQVDVFGQNQKKIIAWVSYEYIPQ